MSPGELYNRERVKLYCWPIGYLAPVLAAHFTCPWLPEVNGAQTAALAALTFLVHFAVTRDWFVSEEDR